MACPDPLCGYPNLLPRGAFYLCPWCSGVWTRAEIEPWRSKPPNMMRAAIFVLLCATVAFWMLAKGW